jgi:hypothetical protein
MSGAYTIAIQKVASPTISDSHAAQNVLAFVEQHPDSHFVRAQTLHHFNVKLQHMRNFLLLAVILRWLRKKIERLRRRETAAGVDASLALTSTRLAAP